MQKMLFFLCLFTLIFSGIIQASQAESTTKLVNIQYIQNLPGMRAVVSDQNTRDLLINEDMLLDSNCEEFIVFQFEKVLPYYQLRKIKNRIYIEFSSTINGLLNDQLIVMKSLVKKINSAESSGRTVVAIELIKDSSVFEEKNNKNLILRFGGKELKNSVLNDNLERLKKKVEDKYIKKDNIPDYLKNSKEVSEVKNDEIKTENTGVEEIFELFGKKVILSKEVINNKKNVIDPLKEFTYSPYDEINEKKNRKEDEFFNHALYEKLKASCNFDRFLTAKRSDELTPFKDEIKEIKNDELKAEEIISEKEEIIEEDKEVIEERAIESFKIPENAKDETMKLFIKVKEDLEKREENINVSADINATPEAEVEVLSIIPPDNKLKEKEIQNEPVRLVDIAIGVMPAGQRVTLMLNDRCDFREISTGNQYILILKDCIKGKQLKNEVVEVQKLPLGTIRLIESTPDIKVIFTLTGTTQPVLVREANRFVIEFSSVEPKIVDYSKGDTLKNYMEQGSQRYSKVMNAYHQHVEKKLSMTEDMTDEEKQAFSELMGLYEEDVLKKSLVQAEEISVARKNAVLTLEDIKYLNFKTGVSQLLFMFNKEAEYHMINTDQQVIVDIKNCETKIDPSILQYYHPVRFIRRLEKGDILRFIIVTGESITVKTEKKGTSLVINLYEKDYFNLESVKREENSIIKRKPQPITSNVSDVSGLPYPDSKKLDLILAENRKELPEISKKEKSDDLWLLEKPRIEIGDSGEGVSSNKLKLAMESAKKKSDANKHFMAGKAYEQHEDYVSAFNEYENALKLVPNDLNIIRAMNAITPKRDMMQYWLDGNRHLDHEDYYKAVYSYEQGLAIEPQNAKLRSSLEKAKKMQKIDIFYKKGVDYYRNNDFNNAISELKKAIELDPSFAKGYYLTGRCLDAKKWHRAAMVQYQEALKLQPFNRDYRYYFQLSSRRVDIAKFYERGRELERAGSYELAMEQYNQAMTLEKELGQDSGRILDKNYAEAEEYMNKGDWEKAIESAGRILQIHPENLKGHSILAQSYMSKGEVSKAVEVYKTMARLDPENEYNLGKSHIDNEKTEIKNQFDIKIEEIQGGNK